MSSDTLILRDTNGRFVAGTVGGPGRRPRQSEQEYLATMERVFSQDVWEAIAERAACDAIDGDARARQWASDYLLGRPVNMAEQPNTDATAWLAELLKDKTPLLPPRWEAIEAKTRELPEPDE